MDSRINYRVEDFLQDDGFINYALDISSESSFEWEAFFKKYSKLVKSAEEAKSILIGKKLLYVLSPSEKEIIKKRIWESMQL